MGEEETVMYASANSRERPRRGEPEPRAPRPPSRRLASLAWAALPLAAALASTAAAESCRDQLERFARQYDLSTTAPQARLREGDPVTPPAPPMTTESRGMSTTDKLKDSGGVIQPPDTGATRVLPPPPTDDRMATAPDVKPQTGSGQAAGNSNGDLGAADRSKLESLVMARLDEARGILEPKSR
jgi:hypothetical protein